MIIPVAVAVVEITVIPAVLYGVQTVVASVWEETLSPAVNGGVAYGL